MESPKINIQNRESESRPIVIQATVAVTLESRHLARIILDRLEFVNRPPFTHLQKDWWGSEIRTELHKSLRRSVS